MKPTLLLAIATLCALFAPAVLPAAEPGTTFAHNVFFTLKDKSPAAQDKLVAACHKYLKNQRGVVSFSAGKRAPESKREVNDLDFDVSLHIVFKTSADQSAYQQDAQHQKFIDENAANWAKVRVFDSYVK